MINDRRFVTNLPKRSWIDSLANFLMPEVYRGSVIDDMFITEKIDCFKPFWISPTPSKCIGHRLSMVVYGFFQCLTFLYFADADGDRLSLETLWRITHANQIRLLSMSMVHRRLV
jgi:hypothetical protein